MNLIKQNLKFFHSRIIRHNLNFSHQLIYSNIPYLIPQKIIQIPTKNESDIETTIELKGRNTRIPRRVNKLITLIKNKGKPWSKTVLIHNEKIEKRSILQKR